MGFSLCRYACFMVVREILLPRGLPLWSPMVSRLSLETVCQTFGIAVASRCGLPWSPDCLWRLCVALSTDTYIVVLLSRGCPTMLLGNNSMRQASEQLIAPGSAASALGLVRTILYDIAYITGYTCRTLCEARFQVLRKVPRATSRGF